MAPNGERRRILGIDPGSYATGWGAIEGGAAVPSLVECGLIRLPRTGPFPVRLHALHDAVAELASRLEPDVACVEAPFHGINARSGLQLAHARGVVLAALGAAGVPVEEVAPASVKRAVTGNGRASKEQVQAMVRRVFVRAGEFASEDVSDALAVAYFWAIRERGMDRLARVGAPRTGSAKSGRPRRRTPVVRRAR